jgi:ribosomal protein S18 acetylase RimI-like enzyme
MTRQAQTDIRRLGPGDEAVVRHFAESTPQTALLGDDDTIFLAAFQDGRPVAFAFGYELPRRHGNPSILFVYELEVDPDCRRQGIATRLIGELRRIAGSRGAAESFVLAEHDNEAANALYASLGGERVETVMWDFGSPER